MVAREDHDQAARTPATFELERFVWAAPDRLALSGKFIGLGDAEAGSPQLVVHGPEGVHELHAPPDSPAPPPEDGSPWAAEFVWTQPPVAFDVATLELGAGIVVELPAPGTERRIRSRSLEVQTPATAPNAGADEVEWQEPDAAHPVERVGLEAELIAAREEIRELRAAVERLQGEVSRAREDLDGERERHAGDGERFREGLERVRRSAAEAVATEHRALTQAEAALRETRTALDGKDAELEDLRRRLDDAVAARTEAESAADEARTSATRMLERLDAIRNALGDGD